MAAKTIFVLCAQALLIQVAFGQLSLGLNGGAGLTLGSGSSLGGLGLGGLSVGGLSGLGSRSSSFGLSSGSLSSGASFGSSSGFLNAGNLQVASGGPLLVTAISPIGPSGLAVASENAIEGNLLVTGQLPFLSAVAFEGALPTSGSGVATCGCGSGQVGITSEGFGRPSFY